MANTYNNLFGNILGNKTNQGNAPTQQQYNAYMQQMANQRQQLANQQRQQQYNAYMANQQRQQQPQYVTNQMANQTANQPNILRNILGSSYGGNQNNMMGMSPGNYFNLANSQYMKETADKNRETSLKNAQEAFNSRLAKAEDAKKSALSNANQFTNMTEADKALAQKGANQVATAMMKQQSPSEIQKGYDDVNTATMRSAMGQNIDQDYLKSLLNPGEDISGYNYNQLMDVLMRTPRPKEQTTDETTKPVEQTKPVDTNTSNTPSTTPVVTTPQPVTPVSTVSQNVDNSKRDRMAERFGLDTNKLPNDFTYDDFMKILNSKSMDDDNQLKKQYGR
jgi:hypothetical protein